MATLAHTPSDDLDANTVAKAVLQGITEDDFASDAVDALLSMVQTGHNDLLGDVLAHLAAAGHPDWAAELCRMVIAGPDGAATRDEKDYEAVAAALVHAVESAPLNLTRKVCSFILQFKSNGPDNHYFDATDISFVLGHMVQSNHAEAAGHILYDFYCDDTQEGRMYQTIIGDVLGSLIDNNHTEWAVELTKQLMYADGDRQIDYSAIGWVMMQMVYSGRPDWPAAIINSMSSQRIRWFNQQAMLQAIGAWGGPQYVQAVSQALSTSGGARNQQWQQQRQQQQAAEAANGHHDLQSSMAGLKVSDSPATPATPSPAPEPASAPATPATPPEAGAATPSPSQTPSTATPRLAVTAAPFVPGGGAAAATATPEAK